MQVKAHDSQVQGTHNVVRGTQVSEPRELALRLPWNDDSLCIRLDSGAVYQVICHTSLQAKSIIDQMEQCAGVAIISQNGGLFSHLSVRENLYLPSAYYGSRSSLIELEQDALDLLGATGMARSAEPLEQWMCNSSNSLGRLEKRQVAFVRALLSRPEIVVFDYVFEGLTRSEIDTVISWRRLFHRFFPFRTLIFVDGDFHGLPKLQDCVSVASPENH